MIRRSIPLELVLSVLNAPEQELPAGRDRVVRQSRVLFPNGKRYLLRVVIEVRGGDFTVVTIYRTSRITKYWRSK